VPRAKLDSLRRVLGKNKTGALSSIMVEEPKHGKIFDQSQITDMLIERNKKHFAGTARRSPSLLSKIGWGTTVHRSRRTRFSGMNFHQTNLRNARKAQAIIESLNKKLPHQIPLIHVSRPTSAIRLQCMARATPQHLRPVNTSDTNPFPPSRAVQRTTVLLVPATHLWSPS
jgi:hypothetical protein